MDRTDRIARHTFEVLLSMVVIGALQYSFKISMARMLTVSGYGLLSTVEPIVVLTGSFFLSGFAVALSKFVSEEIAKDNKKTAENYIATALYYIFPLAIGVSIVMILLSDTIAELIFHEPNLGILIRIIVLILPVEALWLILDGIFLGCQESPYYTYVLLIYNALVLCGALFLVSRGMGVEGAVTAMVISDIAGLAAGYLFYVKKFRGRISFHGKRSVTLFKNLVKFAIPKTIASVSIIDIFCITYFLGVAYAGLYNAAVPIARVLLLITHSICLPLLPAISEDYAKDKKYISVYLSDALKYISTATIPLVFVCSIYAEELVTLFFGVSYGDASPVLVILSAAMLIMAYCSVFSVTFQGMGRPNIPMNVSVFAVFFNILLNIYLIPRIGIEGAAFATLASMMTNFVYLSFRIRRYIDLGGIKSDILKIGVISLILVGVLLLFRGTFFIGMGVGLAFYGVAVVSWKIVDIRKFIFRTEEI
jgi:O-antigen/teichoic acid export membrane protein